MQNVGFARQWLIANTVAMLIAFLMYSPIAHGITGGHGRDLTPAQIAAHSLAYAIAGVIVATAQRGVLNTIRPVARSRIAIVPVTFIAASWIGTYQTVVLPGWDTDILLGFLVLGSGVWIGSVPTKGHRIAALIALLSFPVASLVGELCLLAAFTMLGITPALQTSEIQHSVFWITVGGVTGILGGWLSGMALARMLPSHVTQGAARPELQQAPAR